VTDLITAGNRMTGKDGTGNHRLHVHPRSGLSLRARHKRAIVEIPSLLFP